MTQEQAWVDMFQKKYKREPVTPFCDLPWQSRWNNSSSDKQVSRFVEPDNEITFGYLVSVGPLGILYIKKDDLAEVVSRLRSWADDIETFIDK